jgi:hypothetical protein
MALLFVISFTSPFILNLVFQKREKIKINIISPLFHEDETKTNNF